MFKKYLFLLLVLFGHGMALTQEIVEEVSKPRWSTKQKVVVGVAAVAVVTATGVIIYYGPVAIIASIKAAAVATKAKIVAVALKATGAGHVITLGEGVEATTLIISADGTVTAGAMGLIVKAVEKSVAKSLNDGFRCSGVGSTIEVAKAIKEGDIKLAQVSFFEAYNPSTVFATTPTRKITIGDVERVIAFTRDSAECVATGVRRVAGVIKESFINKETSEELVKEEVEEEWVPKPLIAEKIKRMYAKESQQFS